MMQNVGEMGIGWGGNTVCATQCTMHYSCMYTLLLRVGEIKTPPSFKRMTRTGYFL